MTDDYATGYQHGLIDGRSEAADVIERLTALWEARGTEIEYLQAKLARANDPTSHPDLDYPRDAEGRLIGHTPDKP